MQVKLSADINPEDLLPVPCTTDYDCDALQASPLYSEPEIFDTELISTSTPSYVLHESSPNTNPIANQGDIQLKDELPFT